MLKHILEAPNEKAAELGSQRDLSTMSQGSLEAPGLGGWSGADWSVLIIPKVWVGFLWFSSRHYEQLKDNLKHINF